MAIETRISKRDHKPRYLVRVEVRSPDGRRKQQRVGAFTTKRAAEIAEAEAIAKRERGTLLDPSKVTVSQLLEQWLAIKADEVSSNTHAEYSGIVAIHITPALGAIPVQRLTAPMVQAQYAKWRNIGRSPRTIRSCHLVLSQALAYAVRMNMVGHNVARDTQPPKLTRAAFDHWNKEEAIAFLAAARSDGLWPLWDLLLREGMRRGEALGLRWRDVNWERGTIHISQTVVSDRARKGAALIQSRTKTRSGARTVNLTPQTLAALREHRTHWLEMQLVADDWQDFDLIICTRHGTPISPRNVGRSFTRIITDAQLRRITVHQLRHTAASLMLEAGLSPKVISEKLGHSGIEITLNVYGHLAEGMQSDAALVMSRFLQAGSINSGQTPTEAN